MWVNQVYASDTIEIVMFVCDEESPDLIGNLIFFIFVLVSPVEEREQHQHTADDHRQNGRGDGAGDQTHALRLS